MPFLFQSSLGGARQADRDDILNLLLPNLPNHDEETIVSWLSSQLNLLPPALLDQARTHGSASLICNYDELALQGDATLSHAVIRLMRTFWPNRKVGAYTIAKSAIVSDKSLAQIGCERLNLESSLRVSKSHMAGGQHPIQTSMIATFLEALIGAIDENHGPVMAIEWAQVVMLERVLEVCAEQRL